MDMISTDDRADGGFAPFDDHRGRPGERPDPALRPCREPAAGRIWRPRPAADALQRHIAYDIGAERGDAARWPRVSARRRCWRNFSRLLIDPNRGEDDPTLIMRLSDGAVVPGNSRGRRGGAGAPDRALLRALSRCDRRDDRAVRWPPARSPAIVSIHCFTPVWRGRGRPWHVGMLWDADPRLARAADRPAPRRQRPGRRRQRALLRRAAGDTMYRHATGAALPMR